MLKGITIVNYLEMDFQLSWLMRTLFVDKPTYRKITNFMMAHSKFDKNPSPNTTIWRKCRGWMSPLVTTADVGPSSATQSQITK